MNPATSHFKMNLFSVPADPDNEGNLHSPPADEGIGTLEFIVSTCKRWEDYESTYLEGPNPGWDQCVNMAREIYDHGLLPPEDQFYFTHLDFYFRSILVDTVGSESIRITAISDLDDALFSPRILACRAPFWLWEDIEDIDERDVYEALRVAQDVCLKEIKAIFEEEVGPGFCRYPYLEEYILLRRLFHILQFGLGYSHYFVELEATLVLYKRFLAGSDGSNE
ncbi:hypothetical protein SVAN01_02356 [Stagonosporopsis vannaccii]|nr:hypothetical protein SVAN01_02356 [Stagonosporopsis vannaccii]